jgi:glycosyltransferase involved in cell wall biosynthesis
MAVKAANGAQGLGDEMTIASEQPPASPAHNVRSPEVSVVMPCLNEVETLAICIAKARTSIDLHNLSAEIIVADNGSADGSQALATHLGAKVIHVPERGYGSALRAGIEAAAGKYIVMGDADDSYDFAAIYPFIEQLRQGHDLVMGNRFRGGIVSGAMPWSHRWVGNPILTGLGRVFFRAPARDFHCGLRAFTKKAYRRMDLQTTGMEFASEMVIKASLIGLKIVELPTTLYPDGRSRPPHLRSWRDGWRHLRFMLLFSPLWLFFVPGAALFLFGGALAVRLEIGAQRLGPLSLDIHTLLLAGFACLLGYQLVVFSVFTKIFAVREGFHRPSALLNSLFPVVNLEVGVLCGMIMIVFGALGLVAAVWTWGGHGFGTLDPRETMRDVIPGAVVLSLGVQTVFASFFLSILGIRTTSARGRGTHRRSAS